MLGAFLLNYTKSITELDAFYSIDTHQSVGDVRLEFVEHGFAKPHGHIFCHDIDTSTYGITLLPQGIHVVFKLFQPIRIGTEKRIVVNNINYIANLIALKQWYDQVRALFISKRFPGALLEALQDKVDLAIGERIIQLKTVCLKKSDGGRQGQTPESSKPTREFDELWPEIKTSLKLQPPDSATAASRDQFLESIHQGISAHGQDYIRVVQGLDPTDSEKGTRWLQGIIDDIITGSQKILPD